MQKFHKVKEVVDAHEFVFHLNFLKSPFSKDHDHFNAEHYAKIMKRLETIEETCKYKCKTRILRKMNKIVNTPRRLSKYINAMTIVVLKNGRKKAFGLAVCKWPDQFNRKRGYLIARGKAEKELAKKVLATKLGGKK